MKSLAELGQALASQRKFLKYRQKEVAHKAGISTETLSRLERGRIVEFGSRKLLAVLAVLEMEIKFVERGFSGSLDELKTEREK